ncbi:hypothetical protein A3B61_04435 [Candidatus Peribacteria bacterium RIFCSPLOWO2_01_FULL_53_10]|nr:MAG: hypothetical protein A3B61_04435 [Candidatus Peribacteria bacterium RIFCSPLOWO2_01_FULL_53_10]
MKKKRTRGIMPAYPADHSSSAEERRLELKRLTEEEGTGEIVYEKEGGSPLYSLLLLYAGIQFPEKLIQSNQYQTYNPCVKFIVFHADSI